MGQFETWGFGNTTGGGAASTQDAAAVPVTATPTNYTPASADVEAHLAAVDTALAAIQPGSLSSVVADIAARDAIASPSVGDIATAVDASADATVDAGAANYIWDGAAWLKLSEVESLDISVGITGANTTADGNYTQEFADFSQTWNNLSGLSIDQEISILPGNYGGTSFDTAGIDINAFGAPGVNGDHLIGSSEVRFDINAGTEERDLRADSTSVRMRANTSTAADKSAQLSVATQGINLEFGAASDLQLDGAPGTSGQALLSNGPDLPPTWGTLSSVAEAAVQIADSADAGTVKFADAGDGYFEYVIPQADHGVVVGRRAHVTVYDPTDDSIVDSVVVRHSVATGDITIRSLADVAVDVEILGALS